MGVCWAQAMRLHPSRSHNDRLTEHLRHSRHLRHFRHLRHRVYSTLQGETFVHVFSAAVAQAVVLSVWHPVHAFGILYWSVIAGVMN